MRKIIINGDYLCFDTAAGVSRYAGEILKELDLLVEKLDMELVTPVYAGELPEFRNIAITKYGEKELLRWKNLDLANYVKKQNGLFVDLTQAFPFGVKGITCVHDCIPELISTAYSGFGGKYIKKPLKILQRRAAIKRSLAVITVSECSKRDIVRLYHVAPEKITVIGNAWQHIKEVPYSDEIIDRYHLGDKEFFFTLGSRVAHKNLHWIIEAAAQNPASLFIVSGENKYTKKFEKADYPSNIIFTGYITDGEVRSLMARCRAFILPSIYEGFGIPPMEALAEGAEIIVSNAACLPEIYEKSAHYIDPRDDANIDLKQILSTKVSSAEKVLERFSWKKSAESLYRLILEFL